MDYTEFTNRIYQLQNWNPDKQYISKDLKLVNRPQTWFQKLIVFLFKPSEAKSLKLALNRIQVIVVKNQTVRTDLETSERILAFVDFVKLREINKDFKRKFKESTEASCSFLKTWLEDDLANENVTLGQLPENWKRYNATEATSLLVQIK